MTVCCSVCKELLISAAGAVLLGQGSEAEFESLSGVMTRHFLQRHPKEAQTMAAVAAACSQFLFSLAFVSTDPGFAIARDRLRSHLVASLVQSEPARLDGLSFPCPSPTIEAQNITQKPKTPKRSTGL